VVAPQREARNIRELTTTLNVEGKQVTFLVDTGATRSTLKQGEIKNLPLSGDLVSVVGVSGRREDIPISDKLRVEVGPLRGEHAFLVAKHTPMNLLGRDLLCRMGCTITCRQEGVFIDTPLGKR